VISVLIYFVVSMIPIVQYSEVRMP
jgi:hypothetical protein